MDLFEYLDSFLDAQEQQQESLRDMSTGRFFGCSPEMEDLIHHLTNDALGG